MKNNTGTNIRTAKNGFLRTYNLAWRKTIHRRRGGVAAVYYVCRYLSIDDMICTPTAAKPHAEGENICQQYL